MKVVISAGGTGGHIYPALAIIDKIKEMEPQSEFLYIGTTDRMEAKLIPERKIPYLGIEMKGLDRKHPLTNVTVITCFNRAIKKARKAIHEFQPDVVLGIGGYITAPVVYAGAKEKIPTFIHEQNSIPGLSNRFLSRYATKIGVSLEDSLSYFPKEKVVYTGNPRSEAILKAKPVAKESMGLSRGKKLVLIVMGSLGSMTMTQRFKEMIPAFSKKDYEVLLVTGNSYIDSYKQVSIPKNVHLVPFLDNMLEVMKVTDLIISRAGASTIAEVTSLGLPSILVPSPYVTHDHQRKNAQSLEKQGACKVINEETFGKETLLPMIDSLLQDEKTLLEIGSNAKKMSCSDSATKIYSILQKMIGERKS